MRRFNKGLQYALLAIFLASCAEKNSEETKQVESLKVLIAKNIETINAATLSPGVTKYVLAFSDGWTEKTTFGYYSCLQIGDTVLFSKKAYQTDYWWRMKPNCD